MCFLFIDSAFNTLRNQGATKGHKHIPSRRKSQKKLLSMYEQIIFNLE